MQLVLVVEDDFVNQEITRAMLESLGVAVEIASDGEQGVQAFVAGNPDLILMDCLMPTLDGYAATRKIRALESGTSRRVPIIALTARDRAEDRAGCADSGMDGFLPKPFTKEQLRAQLDLWLGKPSTPQTASATLAGVAQEGHLHPGWPAGLRPRTVEELAEAIDQEFAIAATRKFLARLSAVVSDLNAAVVAGSVEDFHRYVHSLRSTSKLFGADALSSLCAEAEKRARSGDRAAFALAAELVKEADAVAGALSRHPWLLDV